MQGGDAHVIQNLRYDGCATAIDGDHIDYDDHSKTQLARERYAFDVLYLTWTRHLEHTF